MQAFMYGIELDPRYCDVIVRRVAGAAGVKAIHTATGKAFVELADERAGDMAAMLEL